MVRPLRIEYSDARYHVMNRGRRGEQTFLEEKDYKTFCRNKALHRPSELRLKRSNFLDNYLLILQAAYSKPQPATTFRLEFLRLTL